MRDDSNELLGGRYDEMNRNFESLKITSRQTGSHLNSARRATSGADKQTLIHFIGLALEATSS